MKLLFDANLSPRLAARLQDLFPGSTHVFDVGLAGPAPDVQVWRFAQEHGFCVVSADVDFLKLVKE